jgi:hypothetical protein
MTDLRKKDIPNFMERNVSTILIVEFKIQS